MGVIKACKPRAEVLKGDLDDAIFAADFGDLISGKAPKVYGDPKIFFQNTYPTQRLRKIVQSVFERLANPKEAGATIRLSTGFGGGKTHTLMALWHLAGNVDNYSLGTELLPAAGRPKSVYVVGVDLAKAGAPVFAQYGKTKVYSLWGDIAYKFGGEKALKSLGEADHPEKQPSENQIASLFPSGPVLILLDEIVIYMANLSEQGQNNLLGFLNKLASVVSKRPQTVLVVTDPADQRVYAKEAKKLKEVEAAIRLDDVFGRKMTDFDPIGEEASKVIIRRLFEKIDSKNAQIAAKNYHDLYKRVHDEKPGLIPPQATTNDYANQILECYPFHPKLMETAQGRLGALQEFNKSRGTLRLFARLIRSIWESKNDIEIINSGDVDWTSDRIQGDLLHRLNRDNFKAVIAADIQKHALELDAGKPGIHVRVASALLLESIPMQANSGLDYAELTLAVLRPEEAGPEPAEALDRLVGVCWHTYQMPGGKGWQFRYEPNIIKQIEERMNNISIEDARSRVMAEVQGYFTGPKFRLCAWPTSPNQVSETAELQLVLCENEEIARNVCDFSDISKPPAQIPRRFKNAILAITATPSAFSSAIDKARRLMAAEQLEKEYRTGETAKLVRDQLQRIKPELQKQFRIQACRAFDRVVLANGIVYSIEEKYQVDEEQILQRPQGQSCLSKFLGEKKLIYSQTDSLDVDLFMKEILPGATPLPDKSEVYTAKAIHERFLSAPRLRLIPDGSIVRLTLLSAVEQGKIVVKLIRENRVFDKDGCIEESDNYRQRTHHKLYAFPLDDTVLITKANSSVAADWKKIDKGPKEPPPPPPREETEVQSIDWGKIIEYSRKRPLIHFELSSKDPTNIKVLLGLIQSLGAETIRVNYIVNGELKDGGKILFNVQDVKPAHPLKPHELSNRIFTSLKEGGDFEAKVVLNFGSEGHMIQDIQLSKLRDEIPEEVTVIAYFGRPAGGSE